jgi:gliding motility-associated lipoprotein GldH
MKMMKRCFLLLIIALISACGQKHVFSDYQTIRDLKWSSTDTLSFAFDIPENRAYQLSLSARHRKDYEFSNLWLKVRLKGMNIDTTFRFEMQLFNLEGMPFGKCSGSTCTQTIPLKKEINFTKGKYDLQLLQLMRKDPLEGIEDVGLIIDQP